MIEDGITRLSGNKCVLLLLISSPLQTPPQLRNISNHYICIVSGFGYHQIFSCLVWNMICYVCVWAMWPWWGSCPIIWRLPLFLWKCLRICRATSTQRISALNFNFEHGVAPARLSGAHAQGRSRPFLCATSTSTLLHILLDPKTPLPQAQPHKHSAPLIRSTLVHSTQIHCAPQRPIYCASQGSTLLHFLWGRRCLFF